MSYVHFLDMFDAKASLWSRPPRRFSSRTVSWS